MLGLGLGLGLGLRVRVNALAQLQRLSETVKDKIYDHTINVSHSTFGIKVKSNRQASR